MAEELNAYDVIMVGSGPAGISAALYTARARMKTLVIGAGEGSLAKADMIENYYGFAEPVPGGRLLADGRRQAQRLGAELVTGQVVNIGYDGEFTVKTNESDYRARAVILATGSSRTAPKIHNFASFEGRGVSYCAVCDAFFYREKDVAVLGCCEYALHEAAELLPVVKSVTLLTNGAAPIPDFPPEIRVITEEIAELEGEERLERVRFKSGEALDISGLFVAIGVAGSSDLARKLGAQTEGLKIMVDENMATSIPGLFAAGDCTGGMMQIAKAVHEGAIAGTEAVRFVRKNKA
jgi:thioredoxin reductase (NADPH)